MEFRVDAQFYYKNLAQKNAKKAALSRRRTCSLCVPLNNFQILGNNRNLFFKREIFYGRSSTPSSILFYAASFETRREISRETMILSKDMG